MRALRIALLIVGNLGFLVLSNVGFKWSALSQDLWGFVRGQVVGNLAGFINVVTLTFLIREISLYRANAVNFGVGFLLVEVLVAGVLFREPLGLGQWLGTLLVFGGVLMICLWR